jgi:hypothetical protein
MYPTRRAATSPVAASHACRHRAQPRSSSASRSSARSAASVAATVALDSRPPCRPGGSRSSLAAWRVNESVWRCVGELRPWAQPYDMEFLYRFKSCNEIPLKEQSVQGNIAHSQTWRDLPSTPQRNDGYRIRPSSSAHRLRDDPHTATRWRRLRRRILLRRALNNYTALDHLRRSHRDVVRAGYTQGAVSLDAPPRPGRHVATCGSDACDRILLHCSSDLRRFDAAR